MNFLRTFGFSAAATLVIWAAVAIGVGPAAFLSVVILTVLEITFSFDNAVVNAKLLGFLSPWWQRFFMTFGILIAVFVVRFALPVVIVALTSGTSFFSVIDLALHQPDVYAAELAKAGPAIDSFGGMFLLMIAGGFFLDAVKDVHWVGPLERRLVLLGRYDNVAIFVLMLGAVVVSMTAPGDGSERLVILLAAACGIALNIGLGIFGAVVDGEEDEEDGEAVIAELTQGGKLVIPVGGSITVADAVAAITRHDPGARILVRNQQGDEAVTGQEITDAINADDDEVQRLQRAREQARAGATRPLADAMPKVRTLVGMAAFVMFIRLEVLDASFSFDGVIGAFAITTSVVVIMAGLGAGALWVRSLTVHLVRAGTLAKYRYLEHGAHWAIAALGMVMLLKVYEIDPPEWFTGSLGLGFIALAVWSSVRHRKLTPSKS